ncbi:hypothetical protein DEO72_LG4g873 [Vigna unguiculata]|uniref:Uncharacterized protein n=1 Tax=Vigna unguiculata TaxID=3917 RepID=A0A4D6LN09_VIGUN|nr:hypothetical protein DEO72_LG4g873 [Vigna unguiculata]
MNWRARLASARYAGTRTLCLLEAIAQAEDVWFGRKVGNPIVLSERVSRSGESLSLKREREECFDGSLTRSPSKRFESWAKCNLVQASVTRLSESSRLVLCVPKIGDKHVAFYGLWPGTTSLELWLGIADEHEEHLSCGSG